MRAGRFSSRGCARTGPTVRRPLAALAAVLVAFVTSALGQYSTTRVESRTVVAGQVGLTLNLEALRDAGLMLESSAWLGDCESLSGEMPLTDAALEFVIVNDQFGRMLGGSLTAPLELTLRGPDGRKFGGGNVLIIADTAPHAAGDFVWVEAATGTRLFEITGTNIEFDAIGGSLIDRGADMRIAPELAAAVGRTDLAGRIVGRTKLHLLSDLMELDPRLESAPSAREPAAIPPPPPGTRGYPNPGPDLIVADLTGVQQFGRVGDQVGLAVGTIACNKGDTQVRWAPMPLVEHPVIMQNLYRLKDGRFEQIGQSFAKHIFGVLNRDACGFGCTPGCTGVNAPLCPGCSDSYSASLNSAQSALGSRVWIHPFTGVFPANANDHTGHVTDGLSYRVIVSDDDLAQDLNGNDQAEYFAEGQVVSPDEHIGFNGVANNQYNNVAYRRYDVLGNAGETYAFTPADATVAETPAIFAWPGATVVALEPEPGQDGALYLAYRVTGPEGGLWSYEYALYNMNYSRSVRSIRFPLPADAVISDTGFHGPPQHPGWPADGTFNDEGLSDAPWSLALSATSIEWSTDTQAQNPNANAVRWGTLYNFRFRATQSPRPVSAVLAPFAGGVDFSAAAVAPGLAGDLDNDGDVDFQDLVALLACYSAGACGDVDADGDTDFDDLVALLANYGT